MTLDTAWQCGSEQECFKGTDTLLPASPEAGAGSLISLLAWTLTSYLLNYEQLQAFWKGLGSQAGGGGTTHGVLEQQLPIKMYRGSQSLNKQHGCASTFNYLSASFETHLTSILLQSQLCECGWLITYTLWALVFLRGWQHGHESTWCNVWCLVGAL